MIQRLDSRQQVVIANTDRVSVAFNLVEHYRLVHPHFTTTGVDGHQAIYFVKRQYKVFKHTIGILLADSLPGVLQGQ